MRDRNQRWGGGRRHRTLDFPWFQPAPHKPQQRPESEENQPAHLREFGEAQRAPGEEGANPGRLLQPAPEHVPGEDAERRAGAVGGDQFSVRQQIRLEDIERHRDQSGAVAIEFLRPAIGEERADQIERNAGPTGVEKERNRRRAVGFDEVFAEREFGPRTGVVIES